MMALHIDYYYYFYDWEVTYDRSCQSDAEEEIYKCKFS